MFNKFLKKIPREVKIVSLYTSVLYFGYGFAEAFIPVLLYSFTNTYAESGALKSIYDIMFFVIAPLAGYWADRISTKKLILLGLCFYPFISLSYFFAGVSSLAIFIVLARILNGISYSLIHVSRQKYLYMYSKNKVATSQGFFDSMVNRSRMVSVAISIVLVKFIPVHMLFLGILPASLIALCIAKRLPDTTNKPKSFHINFKEIYKDIFRKFTDGDPKLRLLVLLGVLITMVYSAFYFFIPIEVFINNQDLSQIALLAVIFTIPESLGSLFGHRIDIDHGKGFIFSSILIILLLVISIFVSWPRWYFVATLVFGIAIEIIELERNKLIARFANHDNYGNITGIKATLDEGLGNILGPVVIGVCITMGGFSLGLGVMIGIILIVLGLFIYKIHLKSANTNA